MKDIQNWHNHPLNQEFIIKEKEEDYYEGVPKALVLDDSIKFDYSANKKIKRIKKYINYKDFDYEKATNWICDKSYKLGWDRNKHGKFDYNLTRRYFGRQRNEVERIGKKYQWIAYREFLCNLMDNYYYKENIITAILFIKILK